VKQEFVQSAAVARSWNSTLLLQGALIVLAYGLLYARLVPGLVNDWYTFSPYSYGFLVPVIAAYLVWQKRGRLKNLPISTSHWGILTLVLALLLFLVAQVITDSFMMRVSMVLAIAALIQTTLGKRFLKELGFPIFYLALMIPVPYVLVNKIVNFLMFFDAKHAASILQLFGIPVYLDSNFLHLPNITLEVADVCSGISSLFALFVLGVFYSSLLPLPAGLKALVTASTVPLAVIANLIRIVVTVGLTYYIGPVVLQSVIHKLHGTFNFVLSFVFLIALAEFLRKKSAATAAAQSDLSRSPVAYGTAPRTLSWRAIALSSLILTIGIWLSAALDSPPTTSTGINLANVPSSFGSSSSAGAKVWADVYHDPTAEQAATRFYTTAEGVPIELFVGHRGDSTGGQRLQSPKLVLPAKWSYIWVTPAQLEFGRSEKIEANWMLTQTAGARRLVLYWYQSEEGTFTGELYYRFASLKERFAGRSAGMLVVRIATPVPESDSSIEQAQIRLKNLAFQVQQELDRIIHVRRGYP